jgi:hypothetical protein
MSVFKRCESEPGPPFTSSSLLGEEEEEEDDDDERRAGVVVWSVRKGDMRSEPVRVRVIVRVSEGGRMREVMGRMGRVTRGTIVRKRGRRWRIRLIVALVTANRLFLFSCCAKFFFFNSLVWRTESVERRDGG